MEDFKFEFETYGPVGIVSNNPVGNVVSEKARIELTFNQPIYTDTFASFFSINPNIPGSIQWEGNKMTYINSFDLSFNTTYNVSVRKGVQSLFGLDSLEDFSFNFTVRSNEIIIGGVLFLIGGYIET